MKTFLDQVTESYVKDNLAPRVWTKTKKLQPQIRTALLKIIKDFLDSSVIKVVPEDIILTGSLANYNWSPGSDVDLHVVVNSKKLGKDGELAVAYLRDQSSLWGDHHGVKIYGYPVEIYVQDEMEPHYSTGIYSIQNDKWLIEPKKHAEPDLAIAKVKSLKLAKEVDDAILKVKTLSPSKAVVMLDALREKIRSMRRVSLKAGGEYATNNLAFKYLRRKGYMERLIDAARSAYDRSVSLSESLLEISETLRVAAKD